MSIPSRDVVVTGLGPVSAVGVGSEAFWAGLCEARLRTTPRTLVVDLGKTVELPIVSMPPSDRVPGLQVHEAALVEQGFAGYRDAAYGLLAAKLALKDAGLAGNDSRDGIGMIQAFEAPGVERTVAQLFGMFSGPPPVNGPPPVYDTLAPCFYNMQPFLYVHVIGKILGLRGFCTAVHNACSSGAIAIELAAQHIRSGQADVMIVLGAECFDTGVRLEWFRRLDLYAMDPAGCRPFDATSKGFFVGEGGAAVVLESADHAAKRGARTYAQYLGGAFAHQAWKQTIPDVRAARLKGVIDLALTRANIRAPEVDLVVPHGAGATLSDGYEAVCVESAWGSDERRGVAAAFKPAVGHLLAASAVMETLCSLLAMKHGRIPPSATPGATAGFPLSMPQNGTTGNFNTLLKLSTGFTGHDAGLVFRKE